MKKSLRYPLRIAEKRQPDLFRSAEDAWFWFIRCESLRMENARVDSAPAQFIRPCEPDDIYLAVMRLHREHRLHSNHLRVLAEYGMAERAPDYRCEAERNPFRVWREALDHLAVALREKGIVE